MRETIGSRQVTVVVGAAGYGKTTAVRAWLTGERVLWCAGSAPAGLAHTPLPEGDPFVVVERPVVLADEPPTGVRLVLVSRTAKARALADRATARTPGPLLAVALVASGWVEARDVSRGEVNGCSRPARARRIADEAAAAARRHRNPAALAEALELSAYLADDETETRRMLTEALGIWRDAGAELEADRVRVALADEVEARLAADRLAAYGVAPAGIERRARRPAVSCSSTIENDAEPEPVRIDTLGRFAVSVGGRPVPLAAWRSRKARDVLRILVARRGRSITREELAESLWPAEPVDRVAHRLSVALSMVRAVLDPERRASADFFITGDMAAIALNKDRLAVDAEVFAEYARYGLDRLRAGRWREARAALEAAERAYTGEFLDDEPYDDHAASAREQFRATFLQVARALTSIARRAADHDDAVRCLLRLLGADPFDEAAHRELIDILTECGRHGEARRARTRFLNAMREIGVPVSGTALTALARR